MTIQATQDELVEQGTLLHRQSIVIDTLLPHPGIDFLVTTRMMDFIERSLEEGKTTWEIWPTLPKVLLEEMASEPGVREAYLQAWQDSGITAASATVHNTGTAAPFRAYRLAMEGIGIAHALTTVLKGDLLIATRARDIEEAHTNGQHCIIINFQDSTPIEDDVNNLETFYNLGVRVIQLTYNLRNLVGSGCYERNDGGLSLFGLEVVKRMNKLGMVIDLSHCGHQTRWDAVRASDVPVALTHTVANALRKEAHPRGTDDKLIRAVGENGGYVGVVILPYFLTEGNEATVDTFIDHIEHIAEVAGIDHVGIGSDINSGPLMARNAYLISQQGLFPRWIGWHAKPKPSGLPTYPEGLEDPLANYKKITIGLLRRGFSEEETKKIVGRNFLEYFRRIVGQ